VSLRQDDGRLVFEVADDGEGFDSETQAPGRGLLNMADRLDALGGALQVRSAPGEGTTITGSLDGVVATTPDAAVDRTDRIPTMPAEEPRTP
jgi:signal transduction histidine kinase